MALSLLTQRKCPNPLETSSQFGRLEIPYPYNHLFLPEKMLASGIWSLGNTIIDLLWIQLRTGHGQSDIFHWTAPWGTSSLLSLMLHICYLSGYRPLPSIGFETFLVEHPLSISSQLLWCTAWKCFGPYFLHLSGTITSVSLEKVSCMHKPQEKYNYLNFVDHTC